MHTWTVELGRAYGEERREVGRVRRDDDQGREEHAEAKYLSRDCAGGVHFTPAEEEIMGNVHGAQPCEQQTHGVAHLLREGPAHVLPPV
jgi:hypothetical protein